ncbi:hypothetical protein DJ66_1168 [Candidatus Liberibacter solanacearum]|uniref:Uncharacterized protein n=1 Tax=Candidatus Liberibacter solanacearum TaxID=556287 RepID=A0A0F4VJ88_9HYPH|nr:hypothetical protein [Candidatus Liberibacter solanacearum]KJZ81573.1 hypothetical protein DJ66_1168 [Candidatus Liberibacter solanacearum]
MITELQEKFKKYVFEDVKANIDEWVERRTCNYKEATRNFRDRIIELRHKYAKDNELESVTPLCPKPSDLADTIGGVMKEYVRSEEDRLLEEYRPLAIEKIANDEVLQHRLQETFAKIFSEVDGGNILTIPHWELSNYLEDHYDEVRHTLNNPSNEVKPYLGGLANELLRSLFTVSLTLKSGDVETTKEVS